MSKIYTILTSALLGFVLSLSPNTYAASFDCSKASSPFENTICSNPNLSSLDDRLAQLYGNAKASTNDPAQLKADQINWIKSARTCGNNISCIENAYNTRISALTPAQSTPAPAQLPPAVEACFQRKIAAFRKEMGQDTPIKFDILNEYESDCAANPNQVTETVSNNSQYVSQGNAKADSYSDNDSGFFANFITYFIYFLFLAPVGIVLFNFYKVVENKKKFDTLYAEYLERERGHPIQINDMGEVISFRKETGEVITDPEILSQINGFENTQKYVAEVMKTREGFKRSKKETSWAAIITNLMGK